MRKLLLAACLPLMYGAAVWAGLTARPWEWPEHGDT